MMMILIVLAALAALSVVGVVLAVLASAGDADRRAEAMRAELAITKAGGMNVVTVRPSERDPPDKHPA